MEWPVEVVGAEGMGRRGWGGKDVDWVGGGCGKGSRGLQGNCHTCEDPSRDAVRLWYAPQAEDTLSDV